MIHGLSRFVVIHQDHGASAHAQQVSSGDHAHVAVVAVDDREITVAFLRHNVPDLFSKVIQVKRGQVLLAHEELHRHALVDQPRHLVGVHRRHDDARPMLLREQLDGLGDRRAEADHNTARVHLDRAPLGLVAVPENDHIVLVDVVFHHVRVRGRDHDLALVKECLRVADHHLGVQGIEDVAVGRVRLGDDGTVVILHIGTGNVIDRDHPVQVLVIVRDRQRERAALPQRQPRVAHGKIAAHAGQTADLHILDPGTDLVQVDRHLCLKLFEHEPGLGGDMAGPRRHVMLRRIDLILEVCVGDRGTDRVRVRVPVSDDRNCSLLIFRPGSRRLLPVKLFAHR